jgi:hypothetical protein
MLDSLEIILDYVDKMKDQVIIIGDLNINFLKNNRNKEKLEVLLNIFGLQTVINVPTRINKKTNFVINQIILNPELWGLKQKFLTQLCQTILDKYFK